MTSTELATVLAYTILSFSQLVTLKSIPFQCDTFLRTVRPRRPTRRPLVARRTSAVIAWHAEAAARQQSKQHRELTAAQAVDQTSLQGETPFKSGSKDRRAKLQRPKEGGAYSDRIGIFMILAQVVLATVHGGSRDIKVGGPCIFCIDVFFF